MGVKQKQDATALMAKGGFPIHKWTSSLPEVLATVPEAQRAVPDKNLELGELLSGRALGVRRDLQSDSLGLTLEHNDRPPAQNAKCCILKKLADCMIPVMA